MLSTDWTNQRCSTWNTALAECWSNWRLWTLTTSVLVFWSAASVLQEPGFFRRQGLQIGWDSAHWAVLTGGTLAMATAIPELAERQRVGFRVSRRPWSVLLGSQAAWSAWLVATVLIVSLVAWIAGRLRGLPEPGDSWSRILATCTLAWGWGALMPGLATSITHLSASLLSWFALWIAGLLFQFPWPIRTLTTNFCPVVALLSVLTSYALATASVQFRLRANRHPG